MNQGSSSNNSSDNDQPDFWQSVAAGMTADDKARCLAENEDLARWTAERAQAKRGGRGCHRTKEEFEFDGFIFPEVSPVVENKLQAKLMAEPKRRGRRRKGEQFVYDGVIFPELNDEGRLHCVPTAAHNAILRYSQNLQYDDRNFLQHQSVETANQVFLDVIIKDEITAAMTLEVTQ